MGRFRTGVRGICERRLRLITAEAVQRKVNAESRADAIFGSNFDLPAVLFDDAITDAEAQPSSLPDRLCRIERIENAMRILDTRAVVGELNTNAIAHLESANPNFSGTITFGYRVDGVVENIQKNLLELVEIGADFRQLGVELAVHLNAMDFQIVLAKRKRVLDDPIDLRWTPFGLALSREAEQVLNDMMRSLGLFI